MAELALDPKEREELFDSRVRPVLFGDESTIAVPTFTLVIGQFGAAMGRASHGVLAEQPETAVMNAAALQAFHPRYADLIRSGSPGAREYLSEAATDWASRTLAHACEAGRSLLVETSIHAAPPMVSLAGSFTKRGFSTHIIVVAVPRAQSLLAEASGHLLDRRAGRNTSASSLTRHDESWDAVRALVGGQETSPTVDRLTLLDGAGVTLFNADRASESAFAGVSRALIAVHSAPMTNATAMQWLSELRATTDYALNERDHDKSLNELLVELHQVAANDVLPQITLPAGSLARQNAEKTLAERLVQLRRATATTQVDATGPVITGPDTGTGI